MDNVPNTNWIYTYIYELKSIQSSKLKGRNIILLHITMAKESIQYAQSVDCSMKFNGAKQRFGIKSRRSVDLCSVFNV